MKKRVVIPKNNAKALLELAQNVKTKHLQDGDASVLKLLNWPQLLLDIESAQQAQTQTETLRRELLASYAERDLKLDTITEMLRNSRDLLTAVYSRNMKQMGQSSMYMSRALRLHNLMRKKCNGLLVVKSELLKEGSEGFSLFLFASLRNEERVKQSL